ncbi:MAG: corrinoid protein [Chloroflexi bacterium]|nr:corrinoid protein [Chloroflexota bacterium]
MELKQEIMQNVIEGKMPVVKTLVEQARKAGLRPEELLNQALIPAMGVVGERYTRGDIYVPEMLLAARAMKAAIAILQPHLVQAKVEPVGRMVIGTVKGDLHDIGKNLVSLMLQGAGLQVIDLGTDVPPDRFIAAVREHQPQFLGMSALLTTTMPNMKTTIESLHAAGIRDSVKVMVGGAPLTADYAREIGADLYARDAADAARRVRAMLVSAP